MTASDHRIPPPPPSQRLFGPWRTAFQWLTTLTVLGVPFIRIDGKSLLRLDFSRLELQALGRRFPIEDLSLFLLLGIVLVLLFLLVTLAFGRAWCGWTCPQTTLVDLVEWIARRLGVKVAAGRLSARPWQQCLLHLIYCALALLVGANLVWYFIPPGDFFRELTAGTLHWAALLTLGVVAAVVYLDLAFLRRLVCREFCPYGRFQTVLVDPGSLVLQYHPDEASRCIRCAACVRACPTGIDIRNGYQIECINCGRCLDACRTVMAKRGQAGIIRYTFGLDRRGPRALLNPRTALVALALAGATIGLAVATIQREPVTLKVGRNPSLLPRPVGSHGVANFFTVYLVNRGNRPVDVRLSLDQTELAAKLSGATALQSLSPGEHRRLEIAVTVDELASSAPAPLELHLENPDGSSLASATLFLTQPLDP